MTDTKEQNSVLTPTMEDSLFTEKMLFIKLQEMMEERFEKLWVDVVQDIKKSGDNSIASKGNMSLDVLKDFFFDYMYNENNTLDFEDYLSQYVK